MARAAAKGGKRKGSATGGGSQAPGAPAQRQVEKKKQQPPSWEDQLFFNRLRNHAKPIFVLLALIFAITFVALGVGSGSSGLSGLFDGIFTSGGGDPVAKAQKQANLHPRDAAAWNQLATALQGKGRTDEALAAIRRYVALQPKNPDAIRQLAALQLAAAQGLATTVQNAQSAASDVSAGSALFIRSPTVNGAAIIPTDPITQALATAAGVKASDAQTKLQASETAVVDAYRRIAALSPKDPTAQVQLGQIAQQIGDTATALVAYRKAVALDPNGPNAPAIKQAIAQLLPKPATTKK